ncbi:MAG: hypothetical protein ACLUTU_09695 [Blautia faecis]
MPDAQSGKKPVAFGDFSYYWVVTAEAAVSARPILEKFSLYGRSKRDNLTKEEILQDDRFLYNI